MPAIHRRKFLKSAGLTGALTAFGFHQNFLSAQPAPANKGIIKGDGKYQIFHRGQYLPWEKEVVDDRFAIAAGKKQPAGMPGMPPPGGNNDPDESGGGPGGMPAGPVPVNGAALRSYNHKIDSYNPLFNSKKHAQAAGYPDVPAFPGFIIPSAEAMDLTIPETLGDKWYYANDGSDLHYTRPIFAGDKLDSKRVEAKFEELTLDSSDLRHFAMRGRGETKDADGKVVAASSTTLRNAYRKIIDGSPKPSFSETMAEWTTYFPKAHYTTDEEWAYIRELWKKETVRGGKVYWEDVRVGEEPAWTCSGPISYLDIIAANPIPMAINPRSLPPEAVKGMFRDQFGNYLPIYAIHYGGRNIPGSRAVFYNFTAANNIIRLVTNFIGDSGFVTRFSWYLMQLFKEMRLPRELNGGQYLDKVPSMKGKSLNRHGSDGDTVIGKGYVTDKYVTAQGDHMIDLTCWGETLDGDILQVVAASAKLPSKKGW